MQTITHEITYSFPDISSLKQAYMSFVRDGGIFIPTKDVFQLGDSVTATLTLPQNNLTFSFTSEVIWITPKNNVHSGIGIQCSEDEGDAFEKAVKELIATAGDTVETDTM